MILVLNEYSLVMMAEVTPVPIPNTEVKLSSADGSGDCPCESRTLPGKMED